MQDQNENRIPLIILHQFCEDVLRAVGVPDDSARIVAESLTRADGCGLFSHGAVRLLPVYVRRLQAGTTRTHPNIQIERQFGNVARLNGDGGLGQVVGSRAMSKAMEMAHEGGVGIVGVHNSSHFGTAAYFVQQAVDENLIGVVMTNAPSNMPPWGSRSPYFGTNPLAVGIPCDQEKPVLLDMSTSVVARGKIVIAAKRGERIPEGWAIDGEGNPTQDANEALTGAVLPMGGHKGSGLALIIDAFCGVLTGAAFGDRIVDLYSESEHVQDVGHFFMALNAEAFMPIADFKERMDQFVQDVHAQPRLPGVDRIYVPGEIEYERILESKAMGVALPGIDELDALAERVGIPALSERSSEM